MCSRTSTSTTREGSTVDIHLIPPRRRRLVPPAVAVPLWLVVLVVVIELAKASV